MKENKKIQKPLFKPEECVVYTDTPKFKKPNQLIIIGGGVSVRTGIEKGLWDKLKDKYVMGLNYSCNSKIFPNPTLQCYVDTDFYTNEIEKLKPLGLVIGKWHKILENIKLPNTIMLQVNDKTYTRNLSEGVYSGLVGMFGLALAIYLLNIGAIFLLGFDFGADGNRDSKNRNCTHFYQGDLNHGGIGKISFYNAKGQADLRFGCFAQEKMVKIYNVSSNSRINTFEKINYETFFSMLDNNTYDQNELRKRIKQKLKEKIL